MRGRIDDTRSIWILVVTDDWVEREFRRWQGVSRCRPLGKDRFFCRYWWFDGIGCSSLVREGLAAGAGTGGVQYGAGRLFVQGPSAEDWRFANDLASGRIKAGGGRGKGKPKDVLQQIDGEYARPVAEDEAVDLDERRRREEVDEKAVLSIDEWAYYDTEAEVSSRG